MSRSPQVLAIQPDAGTVRVLHPGRRLAWTVGPDLPQVIAVPR